MKVVINKTDLASLITAVIGFVGTKASNFHLISFEVKSKMLLASSFDGLTGMKAVVPATVELDTDEKVPAFGVEANVLKELVATLDGAITLSLQDGKLKLEAGKSKARIITQEVSPLPFVDTAPVAVLTGSEFRLLLPLSAYCSDDGLSSLSGVFVQIEKAMAGKDVLGYAITACGANGVTLCQAKFESERKEGTPTTFEKTSLLIPNQFLSKVAKIIGPDDQVTIMASGDGNRMVLGIRHKSEKKAMMVMTGLQSGTYLSDAQLEGLYSLKPANPVELKTAALMAAIARVLAVDSKVLHFKTAKKFVALESFNGNSGTARTDMGFEWPDLDIFMLAPFLHRALTNFGETVSIGFSGNKSAVFISDSTYSAVFMPVSDKQQKEEVIEKEDVVLAELEEAAV